MVRCVKEWMGLGGGVLVMRNGYEVLPVLTESRSSQRLDALGHALSTFHDSTLIWCFRVWLKLCNQKALRFAAVENAARASHVYHVGSDSIRGQVRLSSTIANCIASVVHLNV
jgi:hypothetical protein